MGSADRRREARNIKKRTRRMDSNTGTLCKTVLDENIEDSGNVVVDEVEVAPEVFAQNYIQNNELPPDEEAGPSAASINEEELEIYFIMNLTVLNNLVNLLGQCPDCRNNFLSVSIDSTKKMGLSQQIITKCPCGWSNIVFSSPRVDKNNERSRFDVNIRSVIAFREIGKGLMSIETFCSHMNMPPPMSRLSYSEIVNSLHPIYVEAAEESMSTAAAAIRKDDTVTDIVASFDGTWHKRGYVSLNGVVTCIERVNDKCIDVQVKTKDCKSCTFWEKKKGTAKYEIWKATHKCSINHAGSASVMETAGTLEMFVRPIEKRKLRYITFIGDGDSSSYPSVVQADPYPGTVIQKGECIGHVQKRVGTNLRKLRKEMPKDRKKLIFGKGKMNDSAINYLQNCYGLAIRQNTNSLYQMKKNVSAILFHCSDISPDEERHKWCPRTTDSWCSYWNTSKEVKNKLNLPSNIKDEKEVVELFDRLRDDSLLSKCLHGKTQNVNESLNGIIWTKCPKRVYVTKKTLEICVSSAVLEYNTGKKGIEIVMNKAGLKIGRLQSESYHNVQSRQKRHMIRKSSERFKRRRKDLRAIKKHWIDKSKEQEGETHEAGGF